MIRKFLIALLSLTCVFGAALGVAGCITPELPKDPSTGNDPDNPPVYTKPEEEVPSDLEYVLNDEGTEYTVGRILTKGLTSVSIPDTYKTPGEDEDPLPVTEIADSAFSTPEGKTLKSIIIGANVTKIGASAFSGCTELVNIVIPDNVETMGINAFQGCSALLRVKLGAGLRAISGNMFLNCTSLTGIDIPDTITTIGSNAFKGCTSLSTIKFGGKDTNSSSAFTNIGDGAFGGCTSLTEITLTGRRLQSIGEEAFSGCTELKTVTLGGNALREIGFSCFSNCDKLEKLTIPFVGKVKYNTLQEYNQASHNDTEFVSEEGLDKNTNVAYSRTTSIFGYIFGAAEASTQNPTSPGCSIPHLKLVKITGGTVIPYASFWQCTQIEHIDIGDNIVLLGTNCFSVTNFQSIVLGTGITTVHRDVLHFSTPEPDMIYYKGTAEAYKAVLKSAEDSHKDDEAGTSDKNRDFVEATVKYFSANPQTGYWHYDEDDLPKIW